MNPIGFSRWVCQFNFMHELAELTDKYDLKICSYEGNVSPIPSEFNQFVEFIHKDF